MALVLPFQLDKISTKTIQQKDITRSALALDFYQGFKMALDSVAEKGNDFKLAVLDSRDNTPRAVALSKVAAVKSSDIIIGPVFPDGIKAFSQTPDIKDKLQVSPLAAAMPSQFNNPKLVTLNNSIDQHAWKLADFIGREYKPDVVNVIIVNPRKEDDESFAAPVRSYLAAANGRRFAFTEVASVAGAETKLSSAKTNVIIIASDNSSLVLNGMGKLYARRQKNKIEVYGHPNWAKLKNLDIEKLQGLNTRITSSYYINYKSPEIIRFVAAYKVRYRTEPSEFAFKGFDTGFLFGSLLARYGKDYAKHLNGFKHNGLHNDFQFSYDPAIGYTNKNVMMLRYSGFELMVER
jgi:ABC-type branched-subunit amino acid transport system substrate-binding protein